MQTTDLENAMIAAQKNETHKWVLTFLRDSGNNPTLAEKLQRDGQNHYGPIEYPIEKIVNILGPNKSFKYTEAESTLNERVEKIVSAVQAGWKAPPLIATNFWEDYFELADGGHRYRAFQKMGVEKYLVIFYFRDKASKDQFISSL